MPIPKQATFDLAEYRRRWLAVKAAMEAAEVDVLVTFGPHNIFYLTGMDSENLFDYQCAIVTCTDEAPILVIFDFELARAENSAVVEDIRSYGPFDDPIRFTLAQLNCDGPWRRIALDRATLSVSRYGVLTAGLDQHDLVDAMGLIEGVRLIKSTEELRLMERAARYTDVGVDAALAVIEHGVEDREIAAEVVAAMYRAGSDTVCWGPIVAAGYRSGSAHSTFNGHRIEVGETVFLELTGEISRYVAPLMRTAVVGEPSADMEVVALAVTSALDAIQRGGRAGIPASEVAQMGLVALDEVLSDHIFHHYFGYPVGVGYPPSWIESLDFFIRANNDRPLQSGMTFHLPMSVRKYGEYGVNLSNTIVIEEKGCRVLGQSPAELIAV